MCLILWVAARYRPDMKFFIKITTLKKNNNNKKNSDPHAWVYIYTHLVLSLNSHGHYIMVTRQGTV